MIETRLEIEGDRNSAPPGATITANVALHATRPWTVKRAELALAWYTEGRGMADEAVVQRVELFPPGSEAPATFRRSYPVAIPPVPWTYHGNLVKIHWVLQLVVQHKGGPEQITDLPLQVHPTVAWVS
jgi:hypothetical protein